MARLLAAAPGELATLASVACGFAAAGRDRQPPGPAAVTSLATWPAAVQALALRLYGSASRRTFRAVAVPGRRVVPALSPRAFRALATGTIRTIGGERTARGGARRRRSSAPACRARSSRRRSGTPPRGRTSRTSMKPCMVQASSHYMLNILWTSSTSLNELITMAAKLTAVPPPGRPAGSAAAPRARPDGTSGPRAGRLGRLPAGAPQHGGPWGARRAGGVAVVGGIEQLTNGFLRRLWARPRRGCLRTRTWRPRFPHARAAARHGPDGPERKIA